jgi:hypothetical protein
VWNFLSQAQPGWRSVEMKNGRVEMQNRRMEMQNGRMKVNHGHEVV